MSRGKFKKLKISLSTCSASDYFLTTRRLKIPIPARAGRSEKARVSAVFCTRVYCPGVLDVQGVSGSSPLAPTKMNDSTRFELIYVSKRIW